MRRRGGSQHFYKWIGFPYEGHWLLEPVPGSEAFHIQFTLMEGRRQHDLPQAAELTVAGPGDPMDFGRTALGIPVVSRRAADLLLGVAGADVQFIPTRIDGVDRGFSLVNVVTRLDCVDPRRSKRITIQAPGGRSLGRVPSWVIDPVRAGDHALFRLDNEPMTIIVSDALREQIERQGMVGPGLVELDGEELRQVMPGYRPK